MILINSLLMLAATIFGHFFNYLFHFVTGRFLPPDQYGLLESFLALNYFLAVIISSFSLSVIKTVNRLDFKQLQRLSFKLTLITWLAFLLLYPLLSYLLKFNQPYLFLIFSLQILFAFTPTLYVAIIQAKLRFKQLALLNFLSPFIKTLTAFILLFLGLKISGAIAGLVVSGLLTAGLSYWLVRPYLTITAQKNSNNLTAFWSASRLNFITQLG
ncbi:MAG: oligosaccharide flippase family protein, partial [Patescibacteria group bacterium]